MREPEYGVKDPNERPRIAAAVEIILDCQQGSEVLAALAAEMGDDLNGWARAHQWRRADHLRHEGIQHGEELWPFQMKHLGCYGHPSHRPDGGVHRRRQEVGDSFAFPMGVARPDEVEGRIDSLQPRQ